MSITDDNKKGLVDPLPVEKRGRLESILAGALRLGPRLHHSKLVKTRCCQLCGMPEETAKEYMNLYELFLIQGVSKGVAKAKVADLYSPPPDI